MKNEYEAKFPKIDKVAIRSKLKELRAVCTMEECKLLRKTYKVPAAIDIPHVWARLRTNGKETTLTYKSSQSSIDKVFEIEIIVNDFDKTNEFLVTSGFIPQHTQENKRELWQFNGAEIAIDTWPLIDPLVEVEAATIEKVKETCKLLGLDFEQAYFGSTDEIYLKLYRIDVLKMPQLTFKTKI